VQQGEELMERPEPLPTSTVSQARLQVFEPTRFPTHGVRQVSTDAWGSATIRGKLGQGHADFVEAVLHHANYWEELDSGQLFVEVDPYRVRVSMGGGKEFSHRGMWNLARDLCAATLELDIKRNGLRVMGSIINHVEGPAKATDTLASARGARGARESWQLKVTFSAAYVRLLAGDFRRDYDPEPIARLKHGVTQAIVRHCKTHEAPILGWWHIDTLIGWVGAKTSGQALRDRRRFIKEDASLLPEVGFEYDPARRRLKLVGRGAHANSRGADANSRGAGANDVELTPTARRLIQASKGMNA
jgi:hypothetical protein